jgi:phenylalanyl-tRNA synthetase beta chain
MPASASRCRALVGAELPPGEDGKPFLIKLGKLRGVESQGMLCSARELKLSEDHGGLLELAADAPLGQDIRDTCNLDDTCSPSSSRPTSRIA